MRGRANGNAPLRLTYLGGPSAVIERRMLRLITDPTFDPAGTTYELPDYTLQKTNGPALTADEVGRVDAVLLSHDHHFDNLDNAGSAFAARAPAVLTTQAGADRLGGNAVGLDPWTTTAIGPTSKPRLLVTATPARHGPAGGDRVPVIGFVLIFEDEPERVIYISGDTVWFEAIAEVAVRFDIQVAILNLGAVGSRPQAATR